MNVNIKDLPPSIVALYEATARARGVSLDTFLRDYLIENAPGSPPAQTKMKAEVWEKPLDVCFDDLPSPGPLPDDAISRENIYGRYEKP